MGMTNPCSSVPDLNADLRILATKQDLLVQSLTAGIAEVRDSISTLAKQLERHHTEYKSDLASLVAQTNTQESRIVAIETITANQEQRIKVAEDRVSVHGNRLSQVAAVAVLLSILLPVGLEFWLGNQNVSGQAPVVHNP